MASITAQIFHSGAPIPNIKDSFQYGCFVGKKTNTIDASTHEPCLQDFDRVSVECQIFDGRKHEKICTIDQTGFEKVDIVEKEHSLANKDSTSDNDIFAKTAAIVAKDAVESAIKKKNSFTNRKWKATLATTWDVCARSSSSTAELQTEEEQKIDEVDLLAPVPIAHLDFDLESGISRLKQRIEFCENGDTLAPLPFPVGDEGDNNLETIREKWKSALNEEQPSLSIQKNQRLVAVNIWTNRDAINPVLRDPLALMDGRLCKLRTSDPIADCSAYELRCNDVVHTELHLMPGNYGSANLIGDSSETMNREDSKKWFYFPELTNDEALVFVTFDSLRAEIIDKNEITHGVQEEILYAVPHTAFELPEQKDKEVLEKIPPRESLEARVFVLLEEY